MCGIFRCTMSQKNVDTMDDASSDEDTDTDTDDEDEGKLVFSPSALRAKNDRSRKRLEQKLRSMREDLYERTALEFREMEEVKTRLLENVRKLKEIHQTTTLTTEGEEEHPDDDDSEEEDDREIERLEKQLEEEKEKQRRMLLTMMAREKEEGKKT